MPLKLKHTPRVLKKTFKNWLSRDPFRESSVIAYTAVFSLPGLLVVVVTLTGYFFGNEIVSNSLKGTIASIMGLETAEQVQEMILYSMRSKDSGWATIIGTIVLIVGATGVFVQLQKSLNIIWEVETKAQKSGVWKLIRLRLFSFGLILSVAFLLLISLVITSLLAASGNYIKQHWSDSFVWLFNVVDILVTMCFITVLFAAMYKILPDAKVKWRFVWLGAFFTTVLFLIGKTLLGFYFGTAEPGSGYGAAGSIILILLWTSYSSMIFFFGAEFTKAYSEEYYGIVPANEVAVPVPGRVQ
jgi:membrane protein